MAETLESQIRQSIAIGWYEDESRVMVKRKTKIVKQPCGNYKTSLRRDGRDARVPNQAEHSDGLIWGRKQSDGNNKNENSKNKIDI